jgi:hypothetical protein
MISSNDVSSALAQQQQYLMQSNQMAGMSSMSYMMGGLGAYGQAYLPPPVDLSLSNPIALPQMGFPGMGGAQGYNYGGQHIGYGAGNWAATKTVGSLGAAYSAASIGATAMGAYGGYKMGGTIGSAVKGALGFGGMPLAAGMMGADYAFGQMREGLQEQHGIYSTLGANFNFINSGSRTGRGFSRQDAKSISDMTREMSAVPEMMTSMGELNRVMNSVSQMGLMQGVRSAQEFGRKFKETFSTLQEIAKTMQTSVEGATKFFAEARQSGFYSNNATQMNAAQRQFTQGMTGMSQDMINQMQYTGSMASFGMGGTRISGANHALRTANQIASANQLGIISNDRIQELTGESGAAGIKSMSEMLMGAAHRMSQSSIGHALALATGKKEGGRYTGEMDDEIVEKVRSGAMSMGEMMALARSKSAGRDAKLSFASQRSKLLAETSTSLGVEGISMQLQNVLGSRGFNNPDAMNLVMQRFGVDERQAGAVMEMMKNMPQIQRDMASKAQVEGRRIAETSNYNQNLSFEAIKTKIEKRMENLLSEPLKKMGSDIGNAVSEYVDNFMDGMMERHKLEITKATSGDVISALSGNSAAAHSLMTGAKGALSGVRGNYSMKDNLLSMGTGYNTTNKLEYDYLGSLPKGLVGTDGAGFTQSDKQQQQAISLFSDIQKGKFKQGYGNELASSMFLNKTDDKMAYSRLDEKEAQLKEYLQANNLRLSKMSQKERLAAISKETGLDAQAIGYLQRSSGTHELLGAVNFGKLAGEAKGLANIGNAKELAEAINSGIGDVSGAFENSSGAKALLKTDSASRSAFMAAINGNEEVRGLFTKDMNDAQRDKLLSKYNLKEGDLDSLRELWATRKSDIGDSDLAKKGGALQNAIDRGSAGAALTQLRRQGLDMGKRLEGADDGLKGMLGGLVSGLSGLGGDAETNERTLMGMGGMISGTLDNVAGLKGDRRRQALRILGPGAEAAINYGGRVEQQVMHKGGLSRFLESADDETKSFVEGLRRDGSFDKGDAKKLNQFVRDRTFKGGLAAAGNVTGTDIPGGGKMTEQITSLAKNTNELAAKNIEYSKLNNIFAQTVQNMLGGEEGAKAVSGMRGATGQMGPK